MPPRISQCCLLQTLDRLGQSVLLSQKLIPRRVTTQPTKADGRVLLIPEPYPRPRLSRFAELLPAFPLAFSLSFPRRTRIHRRPPNHHHQTAARQSSGDRGAQTCP